MTTDTIYALASARGKAGVAVVRISGPEARSGVLTYLRSLPPPRNVGLRIFRDDCDVIDRALVVWFEAGHSFTGEEVVELHLHGSPAIASAVLERLGRLDGFRLAEAGEFTRRALENGCLDLSQVEGLSDLLAAETEAQRRQAMRVFSGALGEKAAQWRAGLLRAAALLEAVIDFADEDVPVDVVPEVRQLLADVLDDLRRERDGFGMAERVRDGFEVAILGLPNVGKSTLLNRIAGREAALTSEHAGTTRDVIEVRMELDGLPVTLLDTAGLRDAADPVEALGIERARSRARQADLRVFLLSAPDEAHPEAQPGDIEVLGKADVRGSGVSGLSGDGVNELLNEIAVRLGERAQSAATITRLRHRNAVTGAIAALELTEGLLQGDGVGEEIVSESLRDAVGQLASLVGRLDTEELLGEIFSNFCIGK
jgi:tRNA modification GTPase